VTTSAILQCVDAILKFVHAILQCVDAILQFVYAILQCVDATYAVCLCDFAVR
jgi:hypothetical protein